MPDFSRFKTLGTLILKVEDVVLFVGTVPPSQIPATVCIADTVNVFPSADIPVILLKVGRASAGSLNAIIESVFTPTLPEKLLLILVIAVPTALI